MAKEDLKVLLLKKEDLQGLIQSGDLDKRCVEALKKISKRRKRSTASALLENFFKKGAVHKMKGIDTKTMSSISL